MGAVCCVATKDKTIQSASPSELLHRNIRYSPTWNFRWDHRGRVAGEDTTVTWFSNGISGNEGLENKNESLHVLEDGSPMQNYRRNRSQKFPISEGTARNVINSSSDQTISRNVSTNVKMEQVKELAESSSVSWPYPSKIPRSLPSTSLSVSPLPFQSHPLPLPSSSTSSRKPCHSTGQQLSRQDSVSRVLGFKTSSNFHASEEMPVFPSWSNESGMHFHGESLDNCSRPGFELTGSSLKESWSFDSESFGFNCERLVRSSSQFSNSTVDLQTCGVCSKLLTEKSFWGTQKIIASNDLSVVSVLICGHVYHAECLESFTTEINKYDPPCPVCTFGENYTLKLSEKALKAEMDWKARNKISRHRIVDSDIDDDSVVYEHFREKERQGKGPRIDSCSSGRSSNGKPFLRRHFSFGSRSSKSMLDNQPTRKKGFFWAKSSK
ncbi:hypothetical protein CR513_03997, partial [Mucuna pruriens]